MLTKEHIPDLIRLSQENGFPYKLTEKTAEKYCNNATLTRPSIHTYGVYEDDKLVSVVTATNDFVFPCESEEFGRVCFISDAYTLPEYKEKGYDTALTKEIKTDAIEYFRINHVKYK